RRCTRASTSPAPARASRLRPRSAPSARSVPTSSGCRPCRRSSRPATAGSASPRSPWSPTSRRAWGTPRCRTSRRWPRASAAPPPWLRCCDDGWPGMLEPREMVALVDLTSLTGEETDEEISRLCAQAQTPAGPVAAVCVYGQYVTRAVAELDGSGIPVAAVANFPEGDLDAGRAVRETEQ